MMDRTSEAGFTGVARRGIFASGALLALAVSLLTAAPAAAQTQLRVGIVYSAPSADRFYDRFAYNQLFMIALGNEIGTHSWTHPHETSLLTPKQLEYEFNQSALEIGRRLGVPVVGTAIPGMPSGALSGTLCRLFQKGEKS